MNQIFTTLSREWALQQTQLSTFQYLDGPPPVLRISDPASVTSSMLEVWASSHLKLQCHMVTFQARLESPDSMWPCITFIMGNTLNFPFYLGRHMYIWTRRRMPERERAKHYKCTLLNTRLPLA